MFKGMVPFRYLVLMMGFFAFYCGCVYNEFLSIPTNFWGSCYERVDPDDPDNLELEKIDPDCVYFFGLDPKWYITTNELQFFNSYKMKLSVIAGVT
jgi:V-type H+-transporting ATPase subunit a